MSSVMHETSRPGRAERRAQKARVRGAMANRELHEAFRRAALEQAELRRLRESGRSFACLELQGAASYRLTPQPEEVGNAV